MLKEVGSLKEDIDSLKQSAQGTDYENIISENEILKAKCNDLETKVNTLSRSDEG